MEKVIDRHYLLQGVMTGRWLWPNPSEFFLEFAIEICGDQAKAVLDVVELVHRRFLLHREQLACAIVRCFCWNLHRGDSPGDCLGVRPSDSARIRRLHRSPVASFNHTPSTPH